MKPSDAPKVVGEIGCNGKKVAGLHDAQMTKKLKVPFCIRGMTWERGFRMYGISAGVGFSISPTISLQIRLMYNRVWSHIWCLGWLWDKVSAQPKFGRRHLTPDHCPRGTPDGLHQLLLVLQQVLGGGVGLLEVRDGQRGGEVAEDERQEDGEERQQVGAVLWGGGNGGATAS